ncbi:hypothetical protein NE237_016969 [Protea cynaroides]|uniref:DOMON domain-containing protein n=1 Tax=Protea cynaroides TaxID=273540 RepID=A0A9Q0K753_9MAGN|nr:hypothetical protein NE237_016969 [Protea cynaroides]
MAFMILVFAVLLLQIHHSHSLTCSSQKLTGNRVYDNCNDLPHLSSYLHWSYDSSKSSLKIAFLAPPAKSDGWISWAINPTKPGMIGSQALIAYNVDGNMTVKTFDLNSYKQIVPSKIAYEVSDMEAEYSGGTMTIFATIALPANTTTINQVWQVGGIVVNGIPIAHAMLPDNLNSKGTLDLTVKGNNNNTSSTSSTSSPSPQPHNGGDSTHGKINGITIFLIFACFWHLFVC